MESSFARLVLVLVIVLWCNCNSWRCHGFGTFGFDMHHRFSDQVKGVLSVDDLPKKGSLEYYTKMAFRDRIFMRGRGLAGKDNDVLVFSGGNDTLRISSLGYLHYANVSLGTPSKWFLVALDTGSDLFWVPCDCKSCVKALKSTTGAILDFNIYSPNTSSTSKKVPCSSSLCQYRRGCSGTPSQCPYEVLYLSNNTSSSGILVEDVLHLTDETNTPAPVDANISFGCGQIQTGSFLDGAAPNGLFGLGMDNSSVPSILSGAGLAANSFSMCFGPDGVGRINFGDKGTTDLDETPFNTDQLNPTYNISVTQISVETNRTSVEFSAIFDTGTSFTYLSDPVYTYLSKSFDSQSQDKRHPSDSRIPFEYCYDTSPNTLLPTVTLTMKGGSQFPVLDPIVLVPDVGESTYCLGVVQSPNVNIIGQNFMTGYQVVFDREKLVLGWKKSNCYNINDSSTTPVKVVPPAVAVEPGSLTPEATRDTGRGSQLSDAQKPSVGKSSFFCTVSCTLMILVLPWLFGDDNIIEYIFIHIR